MRENPCQCCCHDHTIVAGYPGGCPYFGSPKAWDPGRPKQLRVEDVIALADRHRARAREVWKIEQAAKAREEWEHRERQWAKIRVVLDEVLAEHRAEVAAQIGVDLERVHELRDGLLAAEQHDLRARVRRLMAKLDR